MKTTKQRLLNIIITMSVAINVVMLGGLGYIALVHTDINRLHSAMNSPVVIYVPRSVGVSDVATSATPGAKQ